MGKHELLLILEHIVRTLIFAVSLLDAENHEIEMDRLTDLNRSHQNADRSKPQ